MAEEISIAGEITRVLDRQPFQPFNIVMTSGDRYEVTGRHQVAVGSSVIILIPPSSHSIYMRANQIALLEVMEPAT